MHILHLPRLGQTMQRGVITAWHVSEGDRFDVGDPLYVIETEKMNTEVEAKLPGTLVRIVAGPGAELPIGAVVGVVADPGESPGEEEIERLLAAERAEPAQAAASPAPAAPAAAQRPAGAPGRIRAVPKARALARELGIDLVGVTPTGADGTITVADVEAAAAKTAAAGPAVRERRPLRGIARAMADNVTRSWREVPQFVQQITVDATELRRRRAAAQAAGEQVGVTDLLVAAVARAATRVPEANAAFGDDEIVLFADVNVSVAVATDRGLLVPVVHGAQSLSPAEIGARIRELAGKARAGTLSADEASGGTITVSNLGMFGVETGFPLVNAPQAVIVFAGAVVERPVVVDGQVAVRPQLGLAIGFDHRVLDGATAARFTAALRTALEETA